MGSAGRVEIYSSAILERAHAKLWPSRDIYADFPRMRDFQARIGPVVCVVLYSDNAHEGDHTSWHCREWFPSVRARRRAMKTVRAVEPVAEVEVWT